ncbi:hypothetical protein [Brucella pseudogrignonensis]|uniref:Uncharacterized protein n=1 Tax=Brucella pseudogrignonensis TaxID=419475 RepID=A0A256GFE0_9HYPH|nr:hypothetical protein [Brucella pseudogrignonensis]OYR25854.1 hypothetical protein CEV34_2636 [Brucella pseudogrignonensis]
MRITDLEKFALEQIWRPYQNTVGYEKRLERLPVSLEATAESLKQDTYWSGLVLSRLRGMNRHRRITFPSYIHHALVDVVRTALQERGK